MSGLDTSGNSSGAFGRASSGRGRRSECPPPCDEPAQNLQLWFHSSSDLPHRTMTDAHDPAEVGEPQPKRRRAGTRQRSASRSGSHATHRSRSTSAGHTSENSHGMAQQEVQAEEVSGGRRAAARPPRPPRRPGRAAAAAAAAAAASAAPAAEAPSAMAAAMSAEELEEEVGRLEPAATMLRQRQVWWKRVVSGATSGLELWLEGPDFCSDVFEPCARQADTRQRFMAVRPRLQAQLAADNEQLRSRLEGLRSTAAAAAAQSPGATAALPPQFWQEQQMFAAPSRAPQQQPAAMQHVSQLHAPPVPLFAASPPQAAQAPALQTPPKPSSAMAPF